jgi:hypothetical protein
VSDHSSLLSFLSPLVLPLLTWEENAISGKMLVTMYTFYIALCMWNKLCHETSFALIRSVKTMPFQYWVRFLPHTNLVAGLMKLFFNLFYIPIQKCFQISHPSVVLSLFCQGLGKMQSNTLPGVHCTVQFAYKCIFTEKYQGRVLNMFLHWTFRHFVKLNII